MIAALEREAAASTFPIFSSPALLLSEHTWAAGLIEDKIVAIRSGRVTDYGDHRFDSGPGEHSASRESVQSNDEKEKKRKEMMHVNSQRATIEELVGRG